MERLALVTGGDIVSTFATPELVTLGKCDLIEEVSDSELRVGGGRGIEPSMAPFAIPYEDSRGWKQTD